MSRQSRERVSASSAASTAIRVAALGAGRHPPYSDLSPKQELVTSQFQEASCTLPDFTAGSRRLFSTHQHEPNGHREASRPFSGAIGNGVAPFAFAKPVAAVCLGGVGAAL